MSGDVDPQVVNAILLDKESNPTVAHFDDGVVFNVEANQGNVVVPHPALLLAINKLHNMSDIVSGALTSVSFVGYPRHEHARDPRRSTVKVGGRQGERWH